MSEQAIRLTQYSHGAGCGCKISPKVLDTILHSEQAKFFDPNLLVGNETRDDAAVYDLGNGTCVISTTDFFMPIVDNPFDFGRIAATNAISDVFAMGGKPIMAIAILGWPLDKLPPEVAREVIEGGRFACQQAGIALAGGHSIDAPEPIFGLAVTGVVPTERVKKNSTAQAGCKLFLTKPLGIGVLTTAEKKSLLKPEHVGLATEVMCRMNLAGAAFADIEGVKAMTDVTGFGLLGHLSEMCQGAGVQAQLTYADGMHNFTDGILIAAAFLANPQLGIVTGVAIIAHEIPQEIGDFIVLLNAGFSRTRAYVYNLLCSLLSVAGGVLGYYTLDKATNLIPFVLVFASSGFIYIAVSDLMPQMQRRATMRETIPQVFLIALGVVIVLFLTGSAHDTH